MIKCYLFSFFLREINYKYKITELKAGVLKTLMIAQQASNYSVFLKRHTQWRVTKKVMNHTIK